MSLRPCFLGRAQAGGASVSVSVRRATPPHAGRSLQVRCQSSSARTEAEGKKERASKDETQTQREVSARSGPSNNDRSNANVSGMFQRAMRVARSRGGEEAERAASTSGPARAARTRASRQARRAGAPPEKRSANVALSRLRSEGGGLSLFQARKKLAKVKFQIRYKTELGTCVRLVGSSPELGAWDIALAPQLKWQEDGLWACEVNLPCGQIYEYKYVLCTESGCALQWQQGNNALLAVGIRDALAMNNRAGGEMVLEVLDRWSGPEGSSVVVKKGDQVMQETTREHRLTNWIRDVEDQLEQGAVQVIHWNKFSISTQVFHTPFLLLLLLLLLLHIFIVLPPLCFTPHSLKDVEEASKLKR